MFDRKSCTYSYILADTNTGEAVLIDPVIDLAERDARIINELGLKLKYSSKVDAGFVPKCLLKARFKMFIVNTHMHADHVTGSGVLKKLLQGSQSIISGSSNAMADIKVSHGDIIEVGRHKIEVRSTPGHTNGTTL